MIGCLPFVPTSPSTLVELHEFVYLPIFGWFVQVLEEAGDKAENGDENGAKEKFEEAENKILQSPLQNRPRLAGLLNDIRKVREAVVDRSVSLLHKHHMPSCIYSILWPIADGLYAHNSFLIIIILSALV